jgi:hypothetical protein
MMTSVVNLNDLYDLSDLEMMKMIFSSGDYFPGFYRYTLGTQTIGDESLGLNTLIWLYFEQKMTGQLHSKEDWLDLQHEVHDRDVASESARNFHNFPEVRKMFAEKMMDWYFKAKGFDIAYIDTETKVEAFRPDIAYYFMGSMVKYENQKLHISYNCMTKESSLTLDVTLAEITKYLGETFKTQQITDLFLETQTIATLEFDDGDEGVLNMNEDLIDSYLIKNSEMKVFAAPFESRDLPMRYAKCIRLTNFKRGNDGQFQTWQTDQNW